MSEPVTVPLPGAYQDGYTFTGGDPASPASWVKSPAPGTVEQGHRFTGGDPASPASWAKLSKMESFIEAVKPVARDVALTGGLAPLAMAGRAVGLPMADWMATRGTNAVAGMGAGAEAAGRALPVVGQVIQGRDALVQAVPSLQPYLAPQAKDLRSVTGVTETNLPGDAGGIIDAGVEAAISAPFFPGAGRNLIPAFGAGAGSEAAGRATKGTAWEGAARFAGGLAGGAAGLGAQTVAGRAKDAVVAASRPFTAGGRETIAGQTLNRLATDPEAAVARLAQPVETVPGSRPFAPQVANDPGLLAAQGVLTGAPGRSGDIALQQTANNQARAAAIEAVQPTGSAVDASTFFGSRIAQARAALDADVNAVRSGAQNAERAALDALERQVAALPPGMTAQQAGEVIQSQLNRQVDVIKAVRGRMTEPLYTEARQNVGVHTPAEAMATLNEALVTAAGKPRSVIEDAIKAFSRPDGSPRTSIAELQGTKQALDALIKEAQRAGGLGGLVRTLEDAHTKLRGTMARGEPLYSAADQTHAIMSDKLKPYTEGRFARAVERDPYKPATPVMAPDTVPGMAFKPGADGGAAARDYMATRPSPQSIDALKADISRQALDAYDKGGAKGLATFRLRHEPALNALDPKFSASLKNVATLRANLDATQATGAQAITAAERAAATGAQELAASPVGRFTVADPDKAVSRALRATDAKQQIGALVTEANADTTGAALAGLRRGIVEDLKRSVRTTAQDYAEGVQQSNAGMQRWWSQNRETVKGAFTPDQMKALDVIAGDFGRDARAAVRMNGSPTERNLRSGNAITGSIMEAVLGQRLGDMATNSVATGPIRLLLGYPERQLREVLTDAVLDPAKARTLMLKATAGNVKLAAPTLAEIAGGSALLSLGSERKNR
jgi:hypothetical protein